MQQCVLEHMREPSKFFYIGLSNLIIIISVLMYIHCSFFAQAIIEHPENPLKSQFAPSFLTAYRTASTILRSVSQQFEVWPAPSAGFWALWISAFAAGVCLPCFAFQRCLIHVPCATGCVWSHSYMQTTLALGQVRDV